VKKAPTCVLCEQSDLTRQAGDLGIAVKKEGTGIKQTSRCHDLWGSGGAHDKRGMRANGLWLEGDFNGEGVGGGGGGPRHGYLNTGGEDKKKKGTRGGKRVEIKQAKIEKSGIGRKKKLWGTRRVGDEGGACLKFGDRSWGRRTTGHKDRCG